MDSTASTPLQGQAVSLKDTMAAQNFPLAVAAGIGAAIVGAVLWAVVTVASQYKLGIMAIAVGYLTGKAIKMAGKGVDKKFGYLGAACGLFGCVLGNLLSDVAFYAQIKHVGVTQVLAAMDPDFLIKLMTMFHQPMDFMFYAIGVYEAYRFSFKYKL